MSRFLAFSLVVVSCAGVSSSGEPTAASTVPEAATAFVATLTPEQRAQAVLPFESDERFTWYYTPVERGGLPLKSMSPPQRQAAVALLRAGLSEKGFAKSETIRKLEEVLFAIEGSARRDPELYFVTIFGEPAPDATWGLRYEGHHLSYHWTFVEGRLTASTPQFHGANPAEVRDGPMRGTRALAAEEDLARALLASLTAEQRRAAVISPDAPRDILTTNDREAAIQEDRGLAYADLTATQQGMLLSLLDEHASAQPREVAAVRLQRLRDAGLDRVKFAWMGSTAKGEGHYYRLQGPTFLVEYDNTQNGANHIHAVWRDFNGDFGRDVLAEHYRSARHE